MPDSILSTYGCQTIDEDDIQAVVEALRGQFLTGGPAVRTFESALEKYSGASHALVCGNCTQALHLAAHALSVGPGVSVIVPAITFLASANAPHSLGADIVFSDVCPESGLMEAEHLEEALTRCPTPPAAVIPVHLAGQVMGLPALARVARKHGLKIIEDAAHAIGTTYTAEGAIHSVGDGYYSDATTFSFHPVKHITTGEGGAVLTNDPALYNKMSALRSHGMVRHPDDFQHRNKAFNASGKVNPWYYEMPDFGYNYRLTDIQAALGTSQLKKLPAYIAKRTRLKALYDELLSAYAPDVKPLKVTKDCNPAWHLYTVLINFEGLKKDRGDVMRELASQGIGTQVHYIPVHTQPYYQAKSPTSSLPGADRYYAGTLTLPLHVQMEEMHVERAVQTLAKTLGL